MTPIELLTALRNAGTDASVTDILRRNQMMATPEARKRLSSQLCKLRDKGLAVSHQQDGVNYWSWTLKGLAELGDISADIPTPEVVPESPEIQPVEPDISADSSGPDLPDPLECEPDGPDDIRPALIAESARIVRRACFPRVHDALFVLETLAIAHCSGMPAYQEEIERIADYLREVAA